MSPLDEACRLLVEEHGADFVVVYGSFAAGTQGPSSDIDVLAWAPVAQAKQLTGFVAGHELDAWLYPVDHPFTDPALARAFPSLVLHDPHQRTPSFEAAVKDSRVFEPLDDGQKAAIATWIKKMVARARTGTTEGLQRYHWLLSEGPELWCQLSDRRFEGPKQALAQMRAEATALYEVYGRLVAGGVDPTALEAWFRMFTLRES